MNLRIVILIFIAAFAVRSVGLFRGLETGGSFHPDVAKQVRAVGNYLEGRYVWYTGSLAYDGYPYGLNHVDEWVIRAAWPAVRGAVNFFQPGLALAAQPDMKVLHYICTALRVVYSLLALAAFLWALVRVGVPARERWAWLLLAALSPVLSTVTHAASGDVGTDLFVMLAIACVARARTGEVRARDFLLGGVALGMAFSCKYHGVLGALVPGLFLLLAPISWSDRIRKGLWFSGGLLAGFVALTPHVLIDTGKTLKYIWLNFHYIKNYNVPASFRELPFLERSGISFVQNFPVVLHALGVAAFILAIAAFGMIARRAWRARDAAGAWDFAAIAMPFIVLLLSLIGKPALQPFHFSFLPMPLLLGAALGWRYAGPRLRLVLPVLLLGAALEYGISQRHEWRFWSREDTRVLAARMTRALFLPPALEERLRPVALLLVEGPNMSVFRNRPSALEAPEPSDWLDHPADRLPSTPWSFNDDWVFVDMPAFPRESRLLVLEPGHRIERFAVRTNMAADLPFTFQAATREAEIRARIGGRTHHFTLSPGESRTVVAPRESGDAYARDGFEGRRFAFSAVARGAPVLLRVGREPKAIPDQERLDRKLARTRFIDGVRTGDSGRVPLLRTVALTPGMYALEVDAPRVTTPMTLLISDAVANHPARELRLPLVRTNNHWRVEWRHTSDYLFAGLQLETEHATPYELPWRIRPLAALADEPVAYAPVAWKPEHAFGRRQWTFGNFEIPAQCVSGASLRVNLRMDAATPARETIAGYSAFIHLLDREGKQVFARDIRLASIASHLGGPAPLHDLGPLDLPPGDYAVRFGLYHMRTNTRIRPDAPHTRDRRLPLPPLTITE
ncbi:MAG TPA: glycosyltransferase family 39 protein [Kiritimatiellia bacterium]|nr:glycosyltransferase family 39 protein [Kiritimatiellia bacterium]